MSAFVRQFTRPDDATSGYAGRKIRARVCLLPFGLVLAAATGLPGGNSVILNAPMPLLDASRPKPSPATPDYTPAPRPNIDLSMPPVVRLGPKNQPEWDAKLQHEPHTARPGETQSSSSFSEDLNRKRAGLSLAPTINLRMPLE